MSRLKQGSASPTGLPVGTEPQPAEPKRKKILFLCIGNSCRSQMAEGFAKAYGQDVIEAYSAGMHPIDIVQPLTAKVMLDRGIDLSEHHPKGLLEAPGYPWDLIVNMSGMPLPPNICPNVLEWIVRDPFREVEGVHNEVADQIENLVQRLILSLRMQRE